MSTRRVTLLLVEDDELEVMGIERAIERSGASNRLVVARDGVEALDRLRGEHGRDQLERPYVVLLDLNMPRMNGLELLDELRADPELRGSVVFVLTTSDTEEDRASAYARNVAGYIVKNDSKQSYDHTIELLNRYAAIVELP